MRKIKLTGRDIQPEPLEPIEVGEIVELIPMIDNKGDKYIAVHSNESFGGRCDHCAIHLGKCVCNIPRIEYKQGQYQGMHFKLCVEHNVYFRPVDDILEEL